MDMFRYLNYGLSAVLVFVGVKMVARILDWAITWCIPAVSLVIILSLLGDVDRGFDSRRRTAAGSAQDGALAEPLDGGRGRHAL